MFSTLMSNLFFNDLQPYAGLNLHKKYSQRDWHNPDLDQHSFLQDFLCFLLKKEVGKIADYSSLLKTEDFFFPRFDFSFFYFFFFCNSAGGTQVFVPAKQKLFCDLHHSASFYYLKKKSIYFYLTCMDALLHTCLCTTECLVPPEARKHHIPWN